MPFTGAAANDVKLSSRAARGSGGADGYVELRRFHFNKYAPVLDRSPKPVDDTRTLLRFYLQNCAVEERKCVVEITSVNSLDAANLWMMDFQDSFLGSEVSGTVIPVSAVEDKHVSICKVVWRPAKKLEAIHLACFNGLIQFVPEWMPDCVFDRHRCSRIILFIRVATVILSWGISAPTSMQAMGCARS